MNPTGHKLIIAVVLLTSLCQIGWGQNWSQSSAGGFGISINRANGSFNVSVGGQLWFTSGNSVFSIKSASGWLSPQNLQLVSSAENTGYNKIGQYNSILFSWGQSSTNIVFQTEFKFYSSGQYITMDQIFPQGLNGTSLYNDATTTTCFPSISLQNGALPQLGYITQELIFATVYSGVGLVNYPSTIQGGVPLVFFDVDAINNASLWNSINNTVVVSPAANFKIQLQAIALEGPNEGDFCSGMNGMLQRIPANFNHTTIFALGNGIRNTVNRWGSTLLNISGKNAHLSHNKNDATVNTLSYWTDNGGYYYYNTEGIKYNYQETIKDIRMYHLNYSIPVGVYQFDSWWYYKAIPNGGLVKWEPRPDVFPNGLQYVQSFLDTPIVMHNRYFSNRNDYKDVCQFVDQTKYAFPVGNFSQVYDLYQYIMRQYAAWGLYTYEQDWLIDQYLYVNISREQVGVAETWLKAMGQSALDNGLYIMYCMPLSSDYLASSEIFAVNQVRASDDYAALTTNWAIGQTSMFASALGLFPFKDVFWTTTEQPDNPYHGMTEPNPQMQALIATMSTGPVGIGDKIGLTNLTIVMQTCMLNGTLLKPSKPLTAIESYYTVSGPKGQVYSTYTEIASNGSSPYTFYYLFSASLNISYSVYPFQVGISDNLQYLYYEWTGSLPVATYPFKSSSPITLPTSPTNATSGVILFNYYVIAPVLSNWGFLGEFDKFAAISANRIRNLVIDSSGVSFYASGTMGESISVAIIPPNKQNPQSFTCKIKADCNAVQFSINASATLKCNSLQL